MIILLSLITMATITEVKAQETDFKLVEKTLNYYLTGLVNSDASTLKKAFHPEATMKWIGKEYIAMNAIEGLTADMKPGEKLPAKTRVVVMNIAGNAASAQLEIEFSTFTYVDFMHVLKIDGEWKIVSKIYYERQKD